MPSSKKIFLSSSIALLIILMFWGIYSLAFKKNSPAPQPQQASNDQSAAPAIQKQPQVVPISDEAVLAPVLSADGSSIKYYSKADGKAYQIDTDGSGKITLSAHDLIGLADVAWSPDTKKVLSTFSLPNSRPTFSFYNYESSGGKAFSKNFDAAVWATNSKIFYEYYDPKTKGLTLNIADPDGSNWAKIADLPSGSISIAPVPKTGLVSFWNKPDAFSETSLQSVPVIGGMPETLAQGRFGADYLWSRDGNHLLMSSVDQKGGSNLQLAVANSQGGEYKNLNIATFVSKCAWSKDNTTVYYAMPGSFPTGSVLPNDYDSGKINTTDSFWKVDIATGKTSQIIAPSAIKSGIDATDLFLNSDESALFFINRIDGKLYRMDI